MRRLPAWIWAGPGSLAGLALLAFVLASGGAARRRGGALEAHGGALGALMARATGRRGLRAMALGHVILARDEASLEEFREHERVHVRQWERWGPVFPLAYLAASAWAWLRGRDPYRGNCFEREAWGEEQDRRG